MEGKKKFRTNPDLKLMDQVREVLRYYHYAYRTEQTYGAWIKRYLQFHGMKQHPKEMGAPEVEQYLSYLASEKKVAVSTQRQALNAIVFLYRDVLDMELGSIAPVRSKRHRKSPTVLTQTEVAQVLGAMAGTHRLMGQLTYGCGLRLMECIRLRVQDVDFGQGRVFIRGGKGGKDRTVVLPEAVRLLLADHIERVIALHEADSARFIFRRRWRENIRMRHVSRAGSMFFRRRSGRSIRGRERRCDTMCWSRVFKRR